MKPKRYTGLFRVKAPEYLVEETKKAAKRKFMNVSEYIRQVLIEKLELEDENDDLPQDD